MTDQALGTRLASKGWFVHPRTNRLAIFDARFLHGVLPGIVDRPTDQLLYYLFARHSLTTSIHPSGRGVPPSPCPTTSEDDTSSLSASLRRPVSKRVTFMVGFWSGIHPKPVVDGTPGASMHLPLKPNGEEEEEEEEGEYYLQKPNPLGGFPQSMICLCPFYSHTSIPTALPKWLKLAKDQMHGLVVNSRSSGTGEGERSHRKKVKR